MKEEIIRVVIVGTICIVIWTIAKEIIGFESTAIIALATIYARTK